MIKDSIITDKQLQDPEKIVESLLRLRDEFYARGSFASHPDAVFKINSCLYSRYPHDRT